MFLQQSDCRNRILAFQIFYNLQSHNTLYISPRWQFRSNFWHLFNSDPLFKDCSPFFIIKTVTLLFEHIRGKLKTQFKNQIF